MFIHCHASIPNQLSATTITTGDYTMGWLFRIGATRKGLVEECTRDWERSGIKTACIAHCYRGGNPHTGVLWTVWECTGPNQEPHRWIGCDLIQYRKSDGWGHKGMDESVGPLYYSCPLGYLNKVPKVANEAWRVLVRAYHTKRRQRRQPLAQAV